MEELDVRGAIEEVGFSTFTSNAYRHVVALMEGEEESKQSQSIDESLDKLEKITTMPNICPKCGVTTRIDNMYTVEGKRMCEYCARSYLYTKTYFYENRSLNFQGTGNLFLGIELEVDPAYNRGYANSSEFNLALNAMHCSSFMRRIFPGKFWITSDCSIGDSGLEFAFHPMSPEVANEFDWNEFTSNLKLYDYEDDNKCGLHVHVSRNHFNDEVSEAIFMYLFNKFYDEFSNVSRRNEDALGQWAARNWHRAENDTVENEEVLLDMKDKAYGGKSEIVNDEPEDTIEVRLFSSTIDPDELRFSVDVVQSVAKLANDVTLDDVISLDYSSFVDMSSNYSLNPITYIKKMKEVA